MITCNFPIPLVFVQVLTLLLSTSPHFGPIC